MKQRTLKNFYILAISFLLVIVSVFGTINLNEFSLTANAASTSSVFTGIGGNPTDETTLYNATNTYQYNGENSNGNSEYVYYNTTANGENNNTVSSGAAQITVLTHGLNGNAAHWSNDSVDFSYDEDSLFMQIDEELSKNGGSGANIYWAKMDSSRSFYLMDLKDPNAIQTDGKYKTINTTSKTTDDPVCINQIVDISKHIVIVFEAKNTSGSNYEVYEEFNYMLSKIIYDVKIANGGILPKVNLVGHSRGGITNLQYALDHPDLVSTLVSIGTPYFGTTTGRIFGEMFMTPCDGLDDIVNAELYYGYSERWNDNYTDLYSQIDAYAYGSYHTLLSLAESIIADNSEKIPEEAKPGITAALASLNGLKLGTAWSNLDDMLIASFVTELLDVLCPNSPIVDGVEIIAQEINFDVIPTFVSWYSDILVPLESQLAINAGSTQYDGGTYLGFERKTRRFIGGDAEYLKVSQSNVPIAHNLEARDSKIISWVIGSLDLGVNSDSAYLTYENTDGTLTFLGYRGTYGASEFSIPSTIGDKTVTTIAPFAFEGETNLTKITIPNTVKVIDTCAFAGLTNLQTVTYTSSNLEVIGYGAFSGCSNLTTFGNITDQITIPASVTDIFDYTFYATKAAKVLISGNPSYIGEAAFACMPRLTSITAQNSSTYFSDNNGVLYNSDGVLMQYPIAKSLNSFTISPSVSNSFASSTVTIQFISQQAFAGATALEEVSFGNIISIGHNAFRGCSLLSMLSDCSNIEYVAPFAFSGTPIMESTADFITIGQVLYKYNGTASTLNETDFPTGIHRIASYAFYENQTIENIYLPLGIFYIDDFAFSYCSNLAEIRYLNTILPYVNEYAFFNSADDLEFYCRKTLIDDLTETDDWYSYENVLEPISTQAYFIDLDTYVTFYYGEEITIPIDKISGYYNKGWQRVDPVTNQVSEEYLTPSTWQDTVSTVNYKADLMVVQNYSLFFYNNTEEQVSNFFNNISLGTDVSLIQFGPSCEISIGDSYSLSQFGFTVNGIYKPFNIQNQMTGYINGILSPGTYSNGNIIVNNEIIASFNGWTLNGESISSGVWLDYYENATLHVCADWEITEFTADINGTLVSYNYFDGFTLPTLTQEGYDFQGWSCTGEDGPFYTGLQQNIVGNRTYLPYWQAKTYTVTLISNQYLQHSETHCGVLGDTFVLPSLSSGYRHVTKWGSYDVGSTYTITGNATLQAVWAGNSFSINYQNLTFNGQTAQVLWDHNFSNPTPNTYEYGVGKDLTRASAFYQASSPYVPHLVFLGWYTNMNFTTKVTSISATQTGTVTVYAKWRYDEDNPTHIRTYTITDSGRFNQPYDQVNIGLTPSLYSELKSIGIKYLTVVLKIRLKEVNDGYQYIFLYNGAGSDATLLWSTDIEHGGTGTNTNEMTYAYQVNIPIESLQNTSYLYVRYGASGAFEDTWQNSKIYLELMYVVSGSDISNPEFTWSYQDPYPNVNP